MRRDDDFGDFYQASYSRLVGQLTVMTGSRESIPVESTRCRCGAWRPKEQRGCAC